MRNLTVWLLCWVGMMAGCAGRSAPPDAFAEIGAQQSCLSIRSALQKDGKLIDYDTLMEVYRKMGSSPVAIPDLHQLLEILIDQRNEDPRIDEMVLILAAKVLGDSKYPIPDAEALFERILQQDKDRISHWVLAFVADAIGSYLVDLPGGEVLVDRVEALQAGIETSPHAEKEYFGNHFLPPPQSRTLIDHLAGIIDRRARQRERKAYYGLLMHGMSEDAILAAFAYIKIHGIPGSGEIPPYPLAALAADWQRLPDEMKQLTHE